MQAATVVWLAVLYVNAPLVIEWDTFPPRLLPFGVLTAVWASLAFTPGRSARDWALAETVAALILVLSGSLLLGTGQYLVALWDRPLIDPWLASADAWLGVSVPALVAWTRPRPWLIDLLHRAYFTLLPQFLLAIIGTGLVLRRSDRLWEFLWHFHVCAFVTVLMSGLFPAACVFTFHGFDALIDQTRFISHFEGLRSGAFGTLRLDDMEGLISFPSFHVAGALMVTWAFRAHQLWFWPLLVLNIALIAATVMLGAHYAIDIVATLAMFACSVASYRAVTRGVVAVNAPGAPAG